MTEIQIRIAHALASAHGHLWATTITADEAVALGTADEIARVTCERDTSEMGGIASPGSLGDPEVSGAVVSHVTGSGRLSWHITIDGSVMLCATRPGRVKAVEMWTQRDGSGWRWHHKVERRARPRHVEAVRVAAEALRTASGAVIDGAAQHDYERFGVAFYGAAQCLDDMGIEARNNTLRAVEAEHTRLFGDEYPPPADKWLSDGRWAVEFCAPHFRTCDGELAEEALRCLAPKPHGSDRTWFRALDAALTEAEEAVRVEQVDEPPPPGPHVEIATRHSARPEA